jgi:tetratricopeptide (TPR) repeat protein
MDGLSTKKTYVLVLCVIILAVAICYHHALNYPFLNWDDYKLIRDNPHNKSLAWDNLKHLLNPFVTGSVKVMRDFSYAVDYQLWGGSPRSIRLGTLLFYVACSFLVFLLLKLLLRHTLAALFGAIIFVVHPLHVESVTWLSARKEALSATFFLLAFLVYIRRARPGMDRRSRYYALSLILYVVAMFSKETAVVLPAMIVLYEAAFGDRTSRDIGIVKRSLPTIPYFLLAAGFTALVIHISAWIHVLKTYHGGSASTNFLSVLVGPFTGMRMLFFPFNLSARYINVLYDEFWSVPVILALLCLIGLIYVAIDNWRHSRIFSFAILWFFIALAPVSNLVPISTLVADRYLFMPSIAYCLLLGFMFQKLFEQRRRRVFAALLVLFLALPVAFAVITHKRNLIWKDNYSLWGSVVVQNPYNVMGHMAFGNVAAEEADWELAIREFQRALWLNWSLKDVHRSLGNVYLRQAQWDKAIYHFNYVLRDTTQDPSLNVVLGEYFQEKGDAGEAITHFRRALQLDTTNVSAQMGIVDAYARMGRLEVALLEYQSLVEKHEEDIGNRIQQNIALAYFQQGAFDRAIDWYQQAAAIDSSDAGLYFGIARSYEAAGYPEKAERHYTRALEINPEYIEALVNLGSLRYRSADFPGALAWFGRALAIDPENSDALSNSAMAHFARGDTGQAITILTSLVEADTLFAPARVNLAAMLIERGLPERAVEHLERVIDRYPDHVIARFNLAYCYALLDTLDAAYPRFVSAIQRGFADEAEVTEFLNLENVRKEARFGEAWSMYHRHAAPPAITTGRQYIGTGGSID